MIVTESPSCSSTYLSSCSANWRSFVERSFQSRDVSAERAIEREFIIMPLIVRAGHYGEFVSEIRTIRYDGGN